MTENRKWPPKPEILVSGTVTHSVKISTANSRFSNMASSTRVSPNDCNNDKQTGMARSASKTSILSFSVLGRCRSRLRILSWSSPWSKPQICRCNFDLSTCHSCRNKTISGFGVRIPEFRCSVSFLEILAFPCSLAVRLLFPGSLYIAFIWRHFLWPSCGFTTRITTRTKVIWR